MDVLRFLIAWANAPFTIAAGVAVLFAALSASGLLGLLGGDGDDEAHGGAGHDAEGGGEHEADAGGDHGADADADADGGDDHDADADADDAGDDHDHDHDHAGGRGVASAFFGTLGLGRMPLSLIWQSYAVIFAVTGTLLNGSWLHTPGGPPLVSLAWTLPVSLLAGYLGVATIARILGPILSSRDQEATSRAQLVGQAGVVISSRITEDFGEVRIRDRTGHDVRVICKLASGQPELREGQEVVVVHFDTARGDLRVAPLDLGPITPRARAREPESR